VWCLGLLLVAAGLRAAGATEPSYRLKSEEEFVQLMVRCRADVPPSWRSPAASANMLMRLVRRLQADVEGGTQTVEYAKVAVLDKLAEYGVDDVVRRLDKPGVVPLAGASLPELADALHHAMHPYDLIEPPSDYNECKREYAEDKSNAREVRGLIHSLCAWWGQGVDMLCQQISNDVQCRRFVKDPFVANPRLRDFTTLCDTNCIDLPLIEMPVSATGKGSSGVASGKQDL
jgi:hypothetical protein